MSKVVIAGSRSIADVALLNQAMDDAIAAGLVVTEVVSGHAQGVDLMGEQWARRHRIPRVLFAVSKQDWRTHGLYAGPLRNSKMAQYADAVVVLWDGESRGSKNMIEQARIEGKPVYVFVAGQMTFHAGY